MLLLLRFFAVASLAVSAKAASLPLVPDLPFGLGGVAHPRTEPGPARTAVVLATDAASTTVALSPMYGSSSSSRVVTLSPVGAPSAADLLRDEFMPEVVEDRWPMAYARAGNDTAFVVFNDDRSNTAVDPPPQGPYFIRIGRLTPSGYDRRFGDGGSVRFDEGWHEYFSPKLVVDARGRPTVVSYDYGDKAIRLRRLNVDGSPDRGFGTDGVVSVTATLCGTLPKVAIDRADRIVLSIGQQACRGDDLRAEIARLKPDGDVDDAFGAGGRVALGALARDFDLLAIGPDDSIVVAQYREPREVHAMRIMPGGEIDLSYGDLGHATSSFPATLNAYDLDDAIVDHASRLVVASTIWRTGMNVIEPVLLRLTAAGAADATFGDAGWLAVPRSNANWKSPLAVTAANEIRAVIGVGGELFGQPSLITVASDVVVHPPIPLGEAGSDPLRVLACDDDGLTAAHGMTIARLGRDGDLDRTFGIDGVARLQHSPDAGDVRNRALVTDQARDAEGRYYVVLQRTTSISPQVEIFRFTADGRVDSTFGASGRLVVAFEGSWAKSPRVLLRAGGFLLLADVDIASSPQRTQLMVHAYDDSGERIAAFGTAGVFRSPTISLATTFVDGVVDDDGGAWFATSEFIPGGPAERKRLVRMTRDGLLDSAFAAGGVLVLSDGPDAIDAWRLFAFPGNALLVVGRRLGQPTLAAYRRIRPDGFIESFDVVIPDAWRNTPVVYHADAATLTTLRPPGEGGRALVERLDFATGAVERGTIDLPVSRLASGNYFVSDFRDSAAGDLCVAARDTGQPSYARFTPGQWPVRSTPFGGRKPRRN